MLLSSIDTTRTKNHGSDAASNIWPLYFHQFPSSVLYTFALQCQCIFEASRRSINQSIYRTRMSGAIVDFNLFWLLSFQYQFSRHHLRRSLLPWDFELAFKLFTIENVLGYGLRTFHTLLILFSADPFFALFLTPSSSSSSSSSGDLRTCRLRRLRTLVFLQLDKFMIFQR